MQRLLFVVILAVKVIGFPILMSGDTAVPIAEAGIPNNDAAKNTSNTSNSSTSSTITTTMTGILDE